MLDEVEAAEEVNYAGVRVRLGAQERELAACVIVAREGEVANAKLVARARKFGVKGERRLKFCRRVAETVVFLEFVPFADVGLSRGLVGHARRCVLAIDKQKECKKLIDQSACLEIYRKFELKGDGLDVVGASCPRHPRERDALPSSLHYLMRKNHVSALKERQKSRRFQ